MPDDAHRTYTDAHLRSVLGSVKTIAMVGASANRIRPSYFVMKYLQAKGFRVIPVNPGQAGGMILGERAYASLADIPEPVDMVDIFRNSDAAGPITDQALALEPRPKVIWMQLTVRNPDAARRAEAQGLTVIMDRCPKIEYSRLHGELSWQGLNSGIISSRRTSP